MAKAKASSSETTLSASGSATAPATIADNVIAARRRRRSSGLPGEPRGDTGAPAFSTLGQASTRNGTKPHTRRTKAPRIARRSLALIKRKTWLLPLALMLLILAAYGISPGPQNPLYGAIFLSYAEPRKVGADLTTPTQYGKGALDFAFVAFYTIVLSFTRELLTQELIRPMAIAAGLKSRAKQARFMEQVYTAMYFGVSGPAGLWIMSRSSIWYFNTTAMYEGFPHKTHEFYFKLYYLLQASYWAQQAVVLVLQLEKPRKDFKELIMHHIVTLALIWLSYRFHFTYMGIAVYITHDVSDFFLATSKTLNYLEHWITGPYYCFFVGVWIYMRHYLNIRLLITVLTEFQTVGPFELNWETQQYKCWLSQYITFALLFSLQCLNIFWLFLILRIAWRYLAENTTEDTRSEVDSDEMEEEARQAESTQQKAARMGIERPEVLVNGVPLDRTDAGLGLESVAAASSGRETRRRKR